MDDLRECWGCVDETPHEQVNDELVCKVCRTVNFYLDSDQGSSSYYWVEVKHVCKHENFRRSGPMIGGYWECIDCGEETSQTAVDEEEEDGFVVRTPYPIWEA